MKCSYKRNVKRTLGRAIRSQIAEMQLPIDLEEDDDDACIWRERWQRRKLKKIRKFLYSISEDYKEHNTRK